MRAFSLLVIVADGLKSLNDHSGADLVEIQSVADFADPHDISFMQRKVEIEQKSQSRSKSKSGSVSSKPLLEKSDRKLEVLKRKTERDIANVKQSKAKMIIENRAALIAMQANMADVMAKAVDVEFPMHKILSEQAGSLVKPSKKKGKALKDEIDTKKTALKDAMKAWNEFRKEDLSLKQTNFTKNQVQLKVAIGEARKKMEDLDVKAGFDQAKQNGAITPESTMWDKVFQLDEQSFTELVEEYQIAVREMAQKSKKAVEDFINSRNDLVVVQKKEAAKWKAARKEAMSLRNAEIAKRMESGPVKDAGETEGQKALKELDDLMQETKKEGASIYNK